jgi:hypothetical protein
VGILLTNEELAERLERAATEAVAQERARIATALRTFPADFVLAELLKATDAAALGGLDHVAQSAAPAPDDDATFYALMEARVTRLRELSETLLAATRRFERSVPQGIAGASGLSVTQSELNRRQSANLDAGLTPSGLPFISAFRVVGTNVLDAGGLPSRECAYCGRSDGTHHPGCAEAPSEFALRFGVGGELPPLDLLREAEGAIDDEATETAPTDSEGAES